MTDQGWCPQRRKARCGHYLTRGRRCPYRATVYRDLHIGPSSVYRIQRCDEHRDIPDIPES